MTHTTPSRTRATSQTRSRRPGAVAAYDGVTAAYLRDISRRASAHSASSAQRSGRSSIGSPSAGNGPVP